MSDTRSRGVSPSSSLGALVLHVPSIQTVILLDLLHPPAVASLVTTCILICISTTHARKVPSSLPSVDSSLTSAHECSAQFITTTSTEKSHRVRRPVNPTLTTNKYHPKEEERQIQLPCQIAAPDAYAMQQTPEPQVHRTKKRELPCCQKETDSDNLTRQQLTTRHYPLPDVSTISPTLPPPPPIPPTSNTQHPSPPHLSKTSPSSPA